MGQTLPRSTPPGMSVCGNGRTRLSDRAFKAGAAAFDNCVSRTSEQLTPTLAQRATTPAHAHANALDRARAAVRMNTCASHITGKDWFCTTPWTMGGDGHQLRPGGTRRRGTVMALRRSDRLMELPSQSRRVLAAALELGVFTVQQLAMQCGVDHDAVGQYARTGRELDDRPDGRAHDPGGPPATDAGGVVPDELREHVHATSSVEPRPAPANPALALDETDRLIAAARIDGHRPGSAERPRTRTHSYARRSPFSTMPTSRRIRGRRPRRGQPARRRTQRSTGSRAS